MNNVERLINEPDKIFLTDGGLETTLVFQHEIDLPYFAAFDLLKSRQGYQTLKNYYESYAAMATHARTGFILESATWRANKDWAEKLGYDQQRLAEANIKAIELLKDIRDEFAMPDSPFLISGCIGPRGDGYLTVDCMSADEAEAYHSDQIATFKQSQADLITAMTLTYPEEAIGICRAASKSDIPVAISFTTETDGRLPNGMTLQTAIELVDKETGQTPIYYMINCAHPDHFEQALEQGADWVKRIKGIRANASRMSHAELDESEQLDAGDPNELGQQYRALRDTFPQFTVLGGCCGTDHNHVGQICHHCVH